MRKEQTFGVRLAALRRERGMTQLELAERMGVTDKAVSKWERDLSLPDAASLPRLAEALAVSMEELMQGTVPLRGSPVRARARDVADLALKAVAAAMGIAVAVLSCLGQAEGSTASTMLGIGLACLAVSLLPGGES